MTKSVNRTLTDSHAEVAEAISLPQAGWIAKLIRTSEVVREKLSPLSQTKTADSDAKPRKAVWDLTSVLAIVITVAAVALAYYINLLYR